MLVCKLCESEIPLDFLSDGWYLHAVALHLNIVHGYPEKFLLKNTAPGEWSVDGKVVVVEKAVISG